MIAVADTSPLTYLVLIGEIELLPALFAEVVIPPAVAAEVADPRAPEPLRTWWQEPPSWIRTADPGGREPPPEEVQRLHRGEREAILLAQRLQEHEMVVARSREACSWKRRQGPFLPPLPCTPTASMNALRLLPSRISRLRVRTASPHR